MTTSTITYTPLIPEPGRTRLSSAGLRSLSGFNPRRITLLDQLDEFTSLVSKVIPICAMWVSGSFLTDKPDPSDIDVLLVFNEDDVANLAGDAAKRLVTTEGLQKLAARRSLNIDAYGIVWRARPDVIYGAEDEEYLLLRGYWDDFWMRMRTVPKTSSPTRACALPRRGYVEVILSGYA